MNVLEYRHIKTPGVYKDRDLKALGSITTQDAADTWAACGVTDRGVPFEPQVVRSFSDYVEKFAAGLKSPFKDDSDLAYAVYGYFQNGGSKCYITRVTGEEPKVAAATVGGLEIEAIDEGDWGNKLSIEIKQSDQPEKEDEEEIDKELFDLSVYLNGVEVERYIRVNSNMEKERFVLDIVNAESSLVRIVGGEMAVAEETPLADGDNGKEPTDNDFKKGFESFDNIKEIEFISIPGQTSVMLQQELLDHCAKLQNRIAIIDPETGLTPDEVIKAKKKLEGTYGIYYYDTGYVRDMNRPEHLKLVTLSGHIAGANVRTSQNRGVHKAAAGNKDGRLVGVIKPRTIISHDLVGELNSAGIIPVVPREDGGGVVLWGARLMTQSGDRIYLPNLRTDIFIEESILRGTEYAVFEPNGPNLWSDLTRDITMFMRNMWKTGALVGDSPAEAYYVKIDKDLNTREVQNSGFTFGEIGYAKVNPSEFIVYKFKQKSASAN